MQQLDQTRHCLRDRSAVAFLDLASQLKVALVEVGIAPGPQFIVEDLRYVVGDKAQMSREIAWLHLRHFPARQVCVPPVMERHVVADGVGEWKEKVRRPCD